MWKIAIASNDGKVINAHFGRAKQFLIFEVTHEKYHLIELRENKPGCSQLKDVAGTMEETIECIKDCDYVVVSQIGAPMIKCVEDAGIKVKQAREIIPIYLERFIEEIG